MDIITKLFDLDLSKFVPAMPVFLGALRALLVIIILAGPILLVTLGAMYLLRPAPEANFKYGFRTYFGMGSVEAWRFSQRIGGLVYIILGGVMTLGALVAFIILLKSSIPTILTGCAARLVIELILVTLTTFTLNIIISIRYDRDGYRRGKR